MTFLLSLFTLLFPFVPAPAPQVLNLRVLAPTAGGQVYVAAYDTPEGFEDEDNIAHAIHPLPDESVRAEISLEVPAKGEYVLAAFQDLNGNGELDKNFFGVPTEPYGFARVPPSKWRTPHFGEIATVVNAGDEFHIELRHWADY